MSGIRCQVQAYSPLLGKYGKMEGQLYRDIAKSHSSEGVEPASSASGVNVRSSGTLSPVTGFWNIFPHLVTIR